jgi:hypothetical protein
VDLTPSILDRKFLLLQNVSIMLVQPLFVPNLPVLCRLENERSSADIDNVACVSICSQKAQPFLDGASAAP